MTLYSRSLTEDAHRTKRFHFKDADGMCAGCRFGKVLVKHGECDPWLWAEAVLSKVASPSTQ
ncbi:hypothetical protein [Glycomyces salinus]|uniref:hypothetical protein n=1 Tax=Glycomyces salinus TaxID=980294 RepID=UPI0018EE3CEA|nr:hypothetical protein [Glycomyces salinus]